MSTTAMLALLIVSFLPFAQSQLIVVDVCELNTYGCHGAQQIILRRWSDSPRGVGHWITDWRTVSKCVPRMVGSRWAVTFVDTNGNVQKVICRSYRETRTANDIEVAERKLYPEENRQPQLR